MRRRLSIPLLVLVLAGCGGNGGGGGGGELSAEDFRQQADAICADYDQRIEDLGQPESLAELNEFIDRAIPIIEEGFAKLQELDPPEELQADWDRAMELNQENLELTRELSDASEAEDQERVQEILAQAEENEQETDRLASELGLERCGEDQGEGS